MRFPFVKVHRVGNANKPLPYLSRSYSLDGFAYSDLFYAISAVPDAVPLAPLTLPEAPAFVSIGT